MIQTVVKRDGRIVGFNEEKIRAAIRKAMLSTESGEDQELLCRIADHITYNGKEQMGVEEIQDCVTREYYSIPFRLDDIRETYAFNETCQETVPQALQAFFESRSFEDAIRNAISIGGDSDTLAAITGAVAEAYYGVPDAIRAQALPFLDDRLRKILLDFEDRFPPPAPRP